MHVTESDGAAGVIPVINRSRVHLQVARGHPFQEDYSLVVWFAQEGLRLCSNQPKQTAPGG